LAKTLFIFFRISPIRQLTGRGRRNAEWAKPSSAHCLPVRKSLYAGVWIKPFVSVKNKSEGAVNEARLTKPIPVSTVKTEATRETWRGRANPKL
jgi:hypothetical protein